MPDAMLLATTLRPTTATTQPTSEAHHQTSPGLTPRAGPTKKVTAGQGVEFDGVETGVGEVRKRGGREGLVGRLPGDRARAAQASQVDERAVGRLVGIIDSMTPAERSKPELLKASRKRRVAAGAGVSVQEVNRLLAQFEQAQKMMKMVAKGGMQKMLRGLKGSFPGMR